MNYNYRYSKRYGYNDNYQGPEPKSRGGGLLRYANQLERQNRARQREYERLQHQNERERVRLEKEKIRLKQQEIALEIQDKNNELTRHIETLQKILEHTLTINDTISFNSLKIKEEFPTFMPPEHLLKKINPPDKSNFAVKPLNWFTRLIPGAEERQGKKVKEAENKYRYAVLQFNKDEAARNRELEKLKKEYEDKKEVFIVEAKKHNQEVDSIRELYSKGDPDAIIYYNELVLERSEYPDDFPQELSTAYDPEEKALRIEYKLPPLSIIPTLKELKYMKKSNELKEIQRKESDINNLYKDVIVAIALRSLHEVFEADQGSHLNVVEFEGDSELADKATGRYMKVYISSSKEDFMKINLALIDKMICFKELGGTFSPV